MFGAGHVDADDGDVRRRADGGGDGQRVGGVGDHHPVGEAGGAQGGRLRLVPHQAGELRGARGAGGGEAEAAGLARRAEDGDRAGAGPLDDAGGRGRRPADVEHGQRDGVGQVVGQHGRDGAGEEDGGAGRRHLLGAAVPARQAVGDPQRGERQGHEGGDALTLDQAQGGNRADLVDDADEHPARPGDRVLHLAAGADDLQDGGAHGLAVAAARLGQLPEGRGVEVQSLYRDAHLVGPDRGVGVQPLRRLGQHAGGLEHPVHPECPL